MRHLRILALGVLGLGVLGWMLWPSGGWASHCDSKPTSATRAAMVACNPRQECANRAVNRTATFACGALPTSGNPRTECEKNPTLRGLGMCGLVLNADTCPGTVSYNPHQECLAAANNLSVTITGAGTVASPTLAINCPGTCNKDDYGKITVTLTARASEGNTFSGWGGDCSVAVGPTCTVMMDKARSVSARFEPTTKTGPIVKAPGSPILKDSPVAGIHGGPGPHIVRASTLTIVLGGNGTGSVATPGMAIDCGNDGIGKDRCSNAYTPGATTRVAAREGSGVFQGWGGACQVPGQVEASMAILSCPVVMNVDKTLPARFEMPKLKVSADHGTITSVPTGINCGTTCESPFGLGSIVSLRVRPNPGFLFSRGGVDCSPGFVCEYRHKMERAAEDNRWAGKFFLPTLVMYISNDSDSRMTLGLSGSVAASQPGARPTPLVCVIERGAEHWKVCEFTPPAGRVTLTFIRPRGTIVEWRGPCSGTDPRCSFDLLTERAEVFLHISTAP